MKDLKSWAQVLAIIGSVLTGQWVIANAVEEKLDARISGVEKVMEQGFADINRRFDGLEMRVQRLENHIFGINTASVTAIE